MRHRLMFALLAGSLTGCAVSQADEIQMGEEYAAQIARQLPLIAEPEINRYINVLGDSLAKLTSRADLDWHFYVVDSREVNAFAVPGGFVYVNRGLIERVDRMDQLAGVLGHEIGHVTRRHTVKQMQAAQRANIGVTLACVLTRICESQAAQAGIQVGAGALFAKFTRDDEAESDAEAVATSIRAGIDPQGIPEMFAKLIEERKSKPEGVEAWFQTHPVEEDRIAATQALINERPVASLKGLTKDSENFQIFKRRLMSLPAPRK